MTRFLKIPVALALAATLVACGDNDSSGGSSSSTGATPSLGQIQNATVNFFRADGSTLLATADTGTTGSVNVDVGNYSGPVIVQVLGDDTDAMYFDEATGAFQNFPASASLFALAPAGGGTVAVTPLTDLAYRAAVRNGLLPLSAAKVNMLNTIVAGALAGGLDILAPPATVAAMSDDLPATDAGRYALILATLAYLGADGSNDPADGTPPALAVLQALISDLADGVIDGTPANTAYADFVSEFNAAILNAASAYAGSELNDEVANGDQAYENPAQDLSALDDVEDEDAGNGGGDTGGGDNGGSDGGGDGDSSGDPSGTPLGSGNGVTGNVDGAARTFTNQVMAPQNGIGNVTIRANGDFPFRFWEITIPPQTGTYACSGAEGAVISYGNGDPFSGVNPFMYISAGSGSCSISAERNNNVLTGTFTATLVDGNGGTHPVSLGGFRVPVAPQSGGDTGGSGNGNDGGGDGSTNNGGGLGSRNGSSGMIDGATETVTEGVLVQERNGYIQIGSSQSDPQRGWGLQLPAAVGVYQCASTPSMFIQFSKNFMHDDELIVQVLSNTFGLGSCTIEVTSISAQSIEGTFSGTLLDNQDNEFPVTGGEFRANRPQ